MPELPEVETVRRTLKNFVLHKTIDSIEVRYPRIIDGDVETFVTTLIHQSICDIDRYGKYLIFILDHDAFISHLRMEGKYNIKMKDEPYDKHDHIIFHMADGTDLRYNDTRKFGRMQLVDKEHYHEIPPLNRLGQEPMDASFDYIYPRIHQSHLPIKQLICFRMGMDPRTRGDRLSKKRILELIEVSSTILKEAIAQGGTTIHSFDANGIHGLFQVTLSVHAQTTCSKCKGPIKKITIAGRGTYYCPHCQKRRY